MNGFIAVAVLELVALWVVAVLELVILLVIFSAFALWKAKW